MKFAATVRRAIRMATKIRISLTSGLNIGQYRDEVAMRWIRSTRRSFENDKTDAELFEQYLGRKPRI